MLASNTLNFACAGVALGADAFCAANDVPASTTAPSTSFGIRHPAFGIGLPSLSPLLALNSGTQRVDRLRGPRKQLVRKPANVGQHSRVDGIALIQVQAEPREKLQAQVAIPIDRCIREPRGEVAGASRERREEVDRGVHADLAQRL